MRVITGTARGKKLITAEGMDVRPTPERVKEALFSAIQFDIEGRAVLDLFAGSGQLGIEALSRGAEKAVFVDQSPISIDHINKNLKTTELADKAKVIRGDYTAVLLGMTEKFDYVFLDPPYASGALEKALKLVQKNVKDFGIIICEHPKEQALPDEVDEFKIKKQYRYGKVFVTFYARKGALDE
ncbi:MAG: 16S rRNA (guanine(966)-N(2))-methyltransferase RsmD [Ruminococcaceae bacterium]|nr:16S rRNA (guanine(966)-N(2))-methyltransferase RsmD [Oscillospiraceae bacterium]